MGMLDRVARKHRWIGLAYCLMGNHYHLVVQIPYGGLSRGLDELNGGYARWSNGRRGRMNHLFGRRFYSGLIEGDAHLLEACRYVVLNPIRAGLSWMAEEWRWSSYRPCAGLDLAPPFLAVDELLGLFGQNPKPARASSRRFVEDGRVLVTATRTEV